MMKAREMALKTLTKVSQQGSYSNLALKAMLENSQDRRENALASMLVYGVLQQMMRLDYIIGKYSSIKMKKLSPSILNILRLGIYQLFFTDKIPQSAAINESVALAKKYGHGASAGFVNAVLRAVQRGGGVIEYPPINTVEYFSTYYSYPKWYCELLINKLGVEKIQEILRAGNEPPVFSLRVNTLKTDRDAVLDDFVKQGIGATAGELVAEEIALTEGLDISRLEAFCKGFVQPQDAASMLVSRVLNPIAGQVVVDCCSAPGGKTTHIAQLMENKGEIFAFDIHSARVNLVKQLAKRLGCSIINVVEHDATVCKKELVGKVDKILVDVPCSGLGIVRRKPEIKYSVEQKGIEELSALQYAILTASSEYLKVGGELVYSTCTVIDRENIDVVEKFLREHKGFEWCDIGEFLPEIMKSSANGGYIQLYPGEYGCDGFFISKIRRRE